MDIIQENKYIFGAQEIEDALAEYMYEKGIIPEGEWELIEGYIMLDRPLYSACMHLKWKEPCYVCADRNDEECQAWKHTPCPDYIEEGI